MKAFYQNDRPYAESSVVERFEVDTGNGPATVIKCDARETVAASDCLKVVGVALAESEEQNCLVIVSEIPNGGYVRSLIEYEVFEKIYAKIVETANGGNHG